jgi:hypothetical protein
MSKELLNELERRCREVGKHASPGTRRVFERMAADFAAQAKSAHAPNLIWCIAGGVVLVVTYAVWSLH